MRSLLIVAAVALLALPAAALAEDSTSDAKAACKAEKRAMGTKLFKQTYAAKSTAKAMANCVDKREPAVAEDAKNAAKECKDERELDPDAFAEKYGKNKNGKNGYGKCVSGKASAATEEETEARVDAAKNCKALRADDKPAFEEQYGTKKSAFGKCVSATARAGEDS
jgi:hypothetical protein